MKTRKQILAAILSGVMVFSLAACGGGDSNADANTTADPTPADSTPADSTPADSGEKSFTIYRLDDVEKVQLMSEEARSQVQKASITPIEKDGALKIGFSQMEVNNNWRIVENDSMETAITEAGFEYVYRDAQSSTEKQNRDIIDLVNEGVDFLVVAPYEATGMSTGLQAAADAGIPVILIDRSTDGPHTTCIMGDFVDTGYKMAKRMREAFGDETINYVEITGTAGSSVALELTEGIEKFVAEDGNMNKVASADGNFGREESLAAMENIIQSYQGQFNAVFTHVDDAAVAAIQALNDAGLTPGSDPAADEIPISSMCGYKDAFDAMIAGDMLCSVECTARFGPVVVDIINRLQEGGEIDNRLVMPCQVYDVNNAKDLLHEAL